MRKLPSNANEKKHFIKGKKAGVIDSTLEGQNRERKRSNKVLNRVDESSGHRKKKSRMQLKSKDQGSDSTDLISQLPDHVIHHILSYLRCKKDAARTSILSKKWRDLWASYLILDFDERKFHKQDRKLQLLNRRLSIKLKKKKQIEDQAKNELFRNYVDSTLQRRVEQNCIIQKFRLHLTYYGKELDSHVSRWINLASQSRIQELDLYIPSKRNLCFDLPQIVFASDLITALRIYGCSLGACNDIKLSNLQKLCFGKLHIDENIIQNLMLSCPLINDLRLIYCIGLKTLVLPSNRLDRVDIHFCHGIEKIEIQSSSLQTFWYHGYSSKNCKINLASCKSLKNLTFEDPKMTDDTFQNHLSNFPVLEHLVLSKCNALHLITITSHQLKTLALRECAQLRETDIDTPNLLSFDYSGQTQRIPFSSLNPSSMKEAKLYFGCSTLPRFVSNNWFNELNSFLKRFDHSKGLKLVVCSGKNVIIHEDMKEVLVPQHWNLKLEIIKSSTSLEDLLHNLLRRWHPVTLSIVSSTSSDFPKQAQLKMENRGEEPSCCKYNSISNKCWRHFLRDAKIENLADTEIRSDWIDWLKTSASVVNQMTFFSLKWKSL